MGGFSKFSYPFKTSMISGLWSDITHQLQLHQKLDILVTRGTLSILLEQWSVRKPFPKPKAVYALWLPDSDRSLVQKHDAHSHCSLKIIIIIKSMPTVLNSHAIVIHKEMLSPLFGSSFDMTLLFTLIKYFFTPLYSVITKL